MWRLCRAFVTTCTVIELSSKRADMAASYRNESVIFIISMARDRPRTPFGPRGLIIMTN